MKKIRKLFFVCVLCLTSLISLFMFAKAYSKVNAASIPSGQALDTVVDTISVADLTFSGLTNQTMIGENKNTDATFTFSAGNTNKNLVFKFKYDVVDDTVSDSNAIRIHLDVADDKWDVQNSLWIRGNGTFFRRYQGSSFNYKELPALTKGLHEIEYGRIALLESGNPTGNYYVYYKLDGVEVRSDINPYDVSKMDGSMFINFSSGNTANKVYDANLSYEAPQYVSISDLKKNGSYVGNSILDKDVAYNYDISNQPTNKSTVFFANVDYKAAEGSQIYILGNDADNWDTTGYVWFQSDKTYFGLTKEDGTKNGNKEIKYATALTAGTQHTIEYGRLAVMNGDTFQNRYHIYFKLDGVVIYGIDQSITSSVAAGGKIHITGSSGFDYLDAYTLEDAKNISVSDLKNNGTLIGNSLDITGQFNLTYDNTDHTPNYSIKAKFKYTAKELKQNQFHFTNTANKWNSASSIILNNDTGTKVNFGKSTTATANVGYHNVSFATTQDKTYVVEFGRLARLVNGVFSGTYYNYLKIDGEIIKEDYFGIPQEVVEGNVVFITADGKNTIEDAYGFEDAKTISVSDLKDGTNSVGSRVRINGQSLLTYDNTDHKENYSLVFKFKYEATELKQNQFHLTNSDNKWNSASSIILNNDSGKKVHLGKSTKDTSQVGWYDIGYVMTAGGVYDVEYGRIALTFNGKFSGKYYVYLKINDTIVKEDRMGIPQEVVEGNVVFITADGKNLIADKDYGMPTYETADEVSISNLKINGNSFGSFAILDQSKKFSYDAVADHKSVVYKFNYEVKDPSTVGCQFHFSDGYSENTGHYAGMVWFRNDKTYLRVGDGQYINTGAAFASAGTYAVELGKKYITAGNEVGKYYVYVKVDGTLLLEYFVEDMPDKAYLFTTAKDGTKLYDINYVDPVFETADEISVGDLKYMNDDNVDTRVLLNEQVKYKYTATAEHKSVKFKFQYAVNNAETINCQFHFTDGWLADNHGGMVWFKNENNLISMVGGGYLKTASFEAGKVYMVEISKLYITSGSDAGNYYISLSVNDVVVLEYIVPDMPDKANIFMTGTNGDVIYDKDYDIDIYEVADQISVGDLKPANAPSAKVITLDQIRSYSYEATTGYKSVVFKFAYEVSDPSTVDCQFHFSDRYSEITKHYAGMIWFRSDKTYLRTANGKYITKDPVFKSAGTYAVELGKVYVTVGKNSGKYYIYVKIADAIVMDCFAEDMPDVAGMFMTGTNGDRLYDVTYTPCTSAHTLTKVDAKAETCTENGHIEYYHCSDCGKMFSDAEGKNEITDIVILKHHTLVHVNAKAETCTENGNIEHFHCTVCGKNYSDDAAKKSLDNVVINAHHTLTKVDAKAETCTEDGNIEHFHCTVCGKNFSDANGTSELKDITVNAHHTLTKVEAKMPTRTEDGNIEHYHCTVCGKNFNDSNASEEITNIAVSYDSSKESLDGTIKSISVADLTIDGVTNQSMIVKNQNTEVTFDFADSYTNKSLVFKFKYDVVDDNKSDSNAIRIHFDVADDKWNSDNSLWIRGDAVYLAVYKNSKYDWSKKAALTLGVHEIEFGRVAVLYNGNPTGEYYVYYKVDGVEINSSVNPYNVSKMGGSMFINFSSGNTANKVYDANLSYESPQYVSISDLKKNGSYVGNSILDKDVAFNYDISNQPTNKSIVFFANVDYKAAEDSQIYILGNDADNWDTTGYVWFQSDKTYFGLTKEDGTKNGNKKIEYATALTAGTQHTIEYGRLAVMNGDTFQNRYHIYFKLDGVVIYGIDQSLTSSVAAGGKIHITGNGGFNYLDAYSLEDAKVIGVKDLKKNDTAIGESLKITEQNTLTYDNADHKDNYSLVVKFKYVATELKQNQFHFTNSGNKWNSASSIILNNDSGKKVHLGKSTLTESQVGWHDTAFTMTAGTTYVVEYGRLARMATGSFTGKYYTYLKIDGEIIKEDYFGIPQEVLEGNVVFITADGKNEIIDTSASETPGEETLDTNIRTISVADLTIDGLTNQSMVAKNQNQEVTFDFADSYTNKSLVFKFKYDVVDDNKSDSNAIRIHFDVADDKWNSDNSLWIRGDAVYLAVYNNSKYDWSKKTALTKGVHEIEFGRVAILNNGNPTGNFYVYYKVDGVEINSSVNPYNVSKMGGNMFINFSSGNTANKVYDANLSYEAPQYVSISDLKNAGSKIKDEAASYDYDLTNQPINKSTVFFAKVDYKVAEDSQIYITTGSENWNTAGYVWFQPSKTYFGITNEDGAFASNKEIKYATALTAGTQHTIEYGRLAVMSGDTFLNRYHVYFKLDGVIIYGIDQPIVSSVAAAGKIHITGNGGFDYIDGYDLEEAKEIGVKDLKKDGAAIGDSLKITEQNNLTYDNDDHKANYSIVVKFKYTATELKQNQFHFTNSGNKWNSASSIILNNDSGKKVHLGKSTLTESQVGWYDISFTMTENTTYAIEFGRLARLANGEFTGKYYTYLKIDGEIIKGEYFEIPQEVIEGNVVFVTADGHNEIISEDATPEEPTAYETADEISVSDLKKNDAAIGSTIILNEHQKFSYDATAANKSVIFRFKYEVITPETIDCQFHFTDG